MNGTSLGQCRLLCNAYSVSGRSRSLNKPLTQSAKQLLKMYPSFSSLFTSACSPPMSLASAKQDVKQAHHLKQLIPRTDKRFADTSRCTAEECGIKSEHRTRCIFVIGHPAHPEVECILRLAVSELEEWSMVDGTQMETFGVSPSPILKASLSACV